MSEARSDDAAEQSPLLDPFAAHEALDRAHLVAVFFSENVADHSYVQAHPELRPVAERLTGELADFYQLVGRVTLSDRP